jgi:hypothetical protein
VKNIQQEQLEITVGGVSVAPKNALRNPKDKAKQVSNDIGMPGVYCPTFHLHSRCI